MVVVNVKSRSHMGLCNQRVYAFVLLGSSRPQRNTGPSWTRPKSEHFANGALIRCASSARIPTPDLQAQHEIGDEWIPAHALARAGSL